MARALRIGEGEHRGRPTLERVTVVANDQVAQGVGLLVLQAPETAMHVRSGQFVHLRIPGARELVLRRPFSVHRVSGERLEILYQVVGRGTLALAEATPGDVTDLIGPLGRGWRVPMGARHALIVAGGLGAAPLGMLAEELAARGVAATVAMGAPTAERLVGREVFESMARRVEVATDDGSEGYPGLVTALSERLVATEVVDVVYACGPEPMSRVVAAQAAQAGVPCQVSLERLMACGVGACLSCTCSTRTGAARACVDGPVFDAHDLSWVVAETPGPLGGAR